MNRKPALFLLLIFTNLIVTVYLNSKIEMGDPNYFVGKDGGIFTRFITTVSMSALYFLVLSEKDKVIFFVLGVIVGLFSIIVSYFILFKFSKLSDIYFQLFATIIFMGLFHIIEKYRSTKDQQ